MLTLLTYRDPLIPETNRFGNHRARITENNSKTIKFGSVIFLCVMVYLFLANPSASGARRRLHNTAATGNKEQRRGPPTIYRHHEGLQIKQGISKRVVYRMSEPKRTAKCIPPPGLHWRCSSWLLWEWCADCGVRQRGQRDIVQKKNIVMSVVFPPATLGPETASTVQPVFPRVVFFNEASNRTVSFLEVPRVRLSISGAKSGTKPETSRKCSQRIPFTPNFLQINSPPVFFL